MLRSRHLRRTGELRRAGVSQESPLSYSPHSGQAITLRESYLYCRYSLSYRELGEMMSEHGMTMEQVMIFKAGTVLSAGDHSRMRPHLKMSGTSYRIDETYVKVGKEWKYLYRAVDSAGDSIEFMLSAKRDIPAAECFFRKLMRAEHRRLPFTIGTGKHASYPEAFAASANEKVLPPDCKLRRVKYLNNVIDQDHRAMRRRWRAAQCFRPFHTAERTLEGVESMHMLRKGQVKRLDGRDAKGQAKFAASFFGVAA